MALPWPINDRAKPLGRGNDSGAKCQSELDAKANLIEPRRVKKQFHISNPDAKEKKIYNDGYAAQRFRRVKSQTPVSLLDALVKSFPAETPEFLSKCLDFL